MESLNQFNNNNNNNQNFQIQNTSNSVQQQEINDQEKVMNKIVLNQKRENFRVEIRKTKTKDLLNNLREKRLVNIQSQYGTYGATENLIQNLAFFFKKYFQDNFEVENIEETLAFTDDLLDNLLYTYESDLQSKDKQLGLLNILSAYQNLKLLERIIQFLTPSQNSSCLKYCINIISHIFEHGKQLLKDNKYDDQIQNPFINRFMAKNGLNLLIEIEQKTSNTELYQQIYQFIEDYDLNNNNYF
ncbi:Armadillo-type fold [Pseudocohnilembus persalinus]|uniref:Armadillo-type fold n=1 Tax=Pseudocohnilembus persalinus TaxID=266149 RepID=A0A0V0QWT7_PSEPJ|nr:Armadillo-type fold [Pseudocohnilembus persalinus]|eukprot:KRX06341.1 Armadillo-type fold [Pseudocohnilembus persalinus]